MRKEHEVSVRGEHERDGRRRCADCGQKLSFLIASPSYCDASFSIRVLISVMEVGNNSILHLLQFGTYLLRSEKFPFHPKRPFRQPDLQDAKSRT